MARKLYRARDKLVRRRVRGALIEENKRTKKRKRVGKAEAEREIVRSRDEDAELNEQDVHSDADAPGRLRSRPNAVEERSIVAKPDAQKRRLRHSAEEVRDAMRGKPEREREKLLIRDEEDEALFDDGELQDAFEDSEMPTEKRRKLRAGERYRDYERRGNDKTGRGDDLDDDDGFINRTTDPEAEDDSAIGRHVINEQRSRRRVSEDDSSADMKKRQRKQAQAFRDAEAAADAASETFEEIEDAETERAAEIAAARKKHRLNHSDESSGMVYGAGRLAKKSLALAAAPAVKEARRQVKDAGEDNAAVEAVGTGAETARKASHHHPQRRTDRASRREENLRENALRREKGIQAESEQTSVHAAQTEHKKKEQIRAFQKKKRQRAIAEAKRKESSVVTAGGFVDSVNSMFTAPKKAKEAAKSFFSEHKGAIIGVCVAGVIFALFALALSSGASLVQGSGTTVISTTYVSTDEDIYAAENAYCALEDGLNSQVNGLQRSHPGYDDYEYQVDEIEHNPYYLISYLQAKYGGFTFNDEIKAEINRLFRQQYTLSISEKSETRTRMETVTQMIPVTDPDTGAVHMEEIEVEQEVEYEHRTQYVVVTNQNFDVIARQNLNDEQLILYNALNRTYGNRPYLFDLNSLPGVGSAGIQFEIPPEALSDAKFMNMIREAEKYLGMTYVWGGKSPRSGFDCSGFVCWVINHCGNGWDIGTIPARSICRKCIYVSPEEARPGDLIFFEKTYDVVGASHVGIYVGNNTMIHCGNPIKYGRIDTRYFKQHFLCFGRLPFYDD